MHMNPRYSRRAVSMTREQLREQATAAQVTFGGELREVRFLCRCGHAAQAKMTLDKAPAATMKCLACGERIEAYTQHEVRS
jgi:transcription initiation factor IIE alpha subunit